MAVTEFEASNREYLRMATTLLQLARQADDESGLWEAADIQWWWRRDQHDDPANARFWIDRDGVPVGVVSFTDSGDTWGCDVIALPNAAQLPRSALWLHALERISHISARPIEINVRDDDVLTASLLADAGFTRGDDSVMTCWMPVGNRRSIPPIAGGYRLFSTRTAPFIRITWPGATVLTSPNDFGSAHSTIPSSTSTSSIPTTRSLLTACSGRIRSPASDSSNQCAPRIGISTGAWPDTSCDTGLDLLARHRCTRLKVSYYEANDPARLLYVGAGFEPRTRTGTYRRPGDRKPLTPTDPVAADMLGVLRATRFGIGAVRSAT